MQDCQLSCDKISSQHPDKFKYRSRPYFSYQHSPTCQLYMAESSIPNAGLGMYTAAPIKKDENVYHPDIVVNYFDFEVNTEIIGTVMNKEQGAEDSDIYKDVVGNKKDNHKNCLKWATKNECAANPKYMLQYCAKSCAAHAAGLLNEAPGEKTVMDYPWLPNEYYWDPTNTESFYEADEVSSLVPGLGALANSHTGLINCEMSRGSNDVTGLHRGKDAGVGAFSSVYNLPYKANKDIPAGMELFVEYGDNWFDEREWKFGPLPLSYHFEEANEIVYKFWGQVKEEDTFAEDLYKLTLDLVTDVKLKMALPSTFEQAKVALTEGTAILTVPNAVRSPEWLEENGICIDNIRAQTSGVPRSGRGAFATRDLSEGDIIAPLPLLHIDRRRIRMFEDSDGDEPHEINEQLIVNYSYGHRLSTLLLFPYSPVVNFVNNNGDKSKVNSEIRWSPKFHLKEWEKLTVEEILQKKQSSLVLEIVATRAIKWGEEIFIDYGDDWDSAWEDHLATWEPPDNHHVAIHQMNMLQKIKTMEELEEKPYAPNIMTICYTSFESPREGIEEYEWNDYQAFPTKMKHASPCEIHERYYDIDPKTGDEMEFYSARMSPGDDDETIVILNGIPRFAIEFIDREYHSDQHLINSFRHPIHIPDSIFPEIWKNLAPKAKK